MDYPSEDTNFAAQRLELPLFLTSRNRIRTHRFWEIRQYIAKNAKRYVPCIEGGADDDEEEDKHAKDGDGKVTKIYLRPLNIPRGCTQEKPWVLAPNRYGIPEQIGIRRKGMAGAFWSKLKRAPMAKVTRVKGATAFYEIPRETEKHRRLCLHHTGRFLTDPRRRRPSTRFMVSNLFTCWRNPKDPGPTNYFVGIFERQKFPKIKTKPLLPYRFLRYSCVPEKKNAAHAKKTSFDPGPGRYELDDGEDALRITLLLDDGKRLKFRRLHGKRRPIDRSRVKNHWRHIYGFGFKRLFMGPPLRPLVVVSKKKPRKVEKEVNLFPTFDYIRMITSPERSPFSIRMEEIVPKPRPIRYNCIVRVIIRRQLRNNKKIAFNSGRPRFPDADMPTSRKTAKPPPLVDQPVMRVPLSEIKSRLHSVPARLRGIFKENRIRPFKFQPFPPVKLLLEDNETHPENANTAEIYPRDFNPLDFFKDEFKRR